MRYFVVSIILNILFFAYIAQAQSTEAQSSQPSSGSQSSDDALMSLLTVLSQSADEHSNDNQMNVGFQFNELYDSNPLDLPTGARSDEISSLNGTFGLNKKWQHTSIAGNYTGGADYYYRMQRQDQMYHEASAAQNFSFGPVTFLVGADYEFLPSSSFGFDATHQITSGSLDLINPDLLPSQNIQTPPLRRTSYTGVSQLGLEFGRSQLSFSGSYGLLQYERNGLPETDQASAAAAYSFALSSRDSIGMSYQYELFRTTANPLQIIDEVATVSYAHRFGNSLTIKVGAGPDLRSYNNTQARLLQGIDPAVAANGSLDYSRRSTHLNVTYTRSTTSGQGVLQGSESDQIQLSTSQGIGRGWAVSGTAGYARSASLARIVKSTGSQLVDELFDSGFYSSALSKKLGMFTFIFGYTLETQDSTAPVCDSGLCQNYPLHHVASVGLSFAPPAVKFR